jgi:hypothetical protein
MPDLGIGATQRDSIFKKKGFWIDLIGRAKARRDFLKESQSRIQEMFEQQNKLSSWVFNGVLIGSNTDSAGFLYVKMDIDQPAPGDVTVSVYKDSAQTQLVAEGSRAGAGSVTLAEQNDSGLSGTVSYAGGGSDDTDIKLQVVQDARRRLAETYSELDEDNTQLVKTIIGTALDAELASAEALLSSLISAYEDVYLRTWLVEELEIPSEFTTTLHDYEYSISADGAVSIIRESGILGYLKDIMDDNSSELSLQPGTVSIGSEVADADNGGLVVFDSKAASQHSLPGTLHVICKDGTIGSARFSVELVPDDLTLLGERSVLADNRAQIYQPYADGPTGVSFTINRGTPTESGDASAIFSNYSSISGESPDNSDDGILYFKVTRQATVGAEWKIEIFSDSARTSLVASATTALGAGNISITMSGSGLSITFDFQRTNAAAAMPGVGNTYETVSLDLNSPALNDHWTIPITNNLLGKFVKFDAEHLQMSLETDATPTIDDNFAKVYPTISESD